MEVGATVGSGGETVDISTERTLGLVGSVLAFASIIPYVGTLLSLLGLVLILIALHGIGNKLGDDRPFKYYLKGILIGIVLVIVAIILIVAALAASSASTGSMENEFTMYPGSNVNIIEEDSTNLSDTGIALVLVGGVIAIAAIIIGAYFQKKAWEAMYELTGVDAFKSTANFLWWGALTLVVLIGAILLLISSIFQIIAFANLPQKLSKRSTTPAPTPVEELSW
ncbi:DUF996 domain-containing protein [Thermococcus sp. AM4]|uniref:DUF996 domain-containing protein n=1 Tax=Thermococcus sp. (strain AM4) TaxID=246969 RepID=UPI000186FE34|nr:DUF996 domain-containing protein [Thermococcus sp. AM4]